MILAVSGSLWRAVRIATVDLISTANGKAIGAAAFERTDKPFGETFVKVLHEEALEPFWATTISSMLATLSEKITPWVPEQIAIIPGKLLGETWHWLITSAHSTNTEAHVGNGGKKGNIYSKFFETFVKKPSDWALEVCGMDEKGGNMPWYTVSQLGIAGLASYSLIGDEEENLPGVNINTDDSFLMATAKGLGYTAVEQGTYAISQTMRFFIDFKDEFGWKENGKMSSSEKKQVWGKVLANVVNERLLPGHLLLGMSSGLTTYYLRKAFSWIPRTTAAGIGELPMSLLNRVLNCRNRRATKNQFEYATFTENGKEIRVPIAYKKDENGEKVKNYRFNDSKTFNRILDFTDKLTNGAKKGLLRIVEGFTEVPVDKLEESLDISEEVLERNREKYLKFEGKKVNDEVKQISLDAA